MLQALTITLREGVEAALIVGITLVYLDKIGRSQLRRQVYAALAAAVLASVAGAALLARARWNQDLFEGWVMLAAAVFVVSMIIFMARAARTLKGQIEGRVGQLAGRGAAAGLFLFVFLLVLREGVETVLILSAVSLNTSELLSFTGTLLGMALAVVFGVMFVKGTLRIHLPTFFKVTSVILLLVAAQLVVSGLHELSENGVLPSSRREMAWIGPIVRNDAFFFVTILALAALMVLFEYRRRAPQPVTEAARAARRKAEWTRRRERWWMASVYASSFVFILLVTAQFIYAKSTTSLSPASEVALVNGKVSIPWSQVSDGDLHRYAAEVEGTRVRFLLYKKPSGEVVAIFDACEICGGAGFHRSGGNLICKNCASPINPQSLGTPGGCNPVPLRSTLSGDRLEIAASDLASGAAHFRN